MQYWTSKGESASEICPLTLEQRLFAALYVDEDVTVQLANELRPREFEAVGAREIGMLSADDEAHLADAAEHQMILLTSNRDDFLHLVLNLLNQVAADDLIDTVCYLTAYR